MTKDWSGNTTSIYSTLGASNHSDEERANYDYYATDPKAVKMLLEMEEFSNAILEPAAGEMHIADVLREAGKTVYTIDIVQRARELDSVRDFSTMKADGSGEFDIITNPPYKLAAEFVEHALNIISPGYKVAMFLKLQFLEGKARGELFKKYPPYKIYVSRSRLKCAKNGEFDSTSSAVAYAWFVWRKGFTGDPIIKWFN